MKTTKEEIVIKAKEEKRPRQPIDTAKAEELASVRSQVLEAVCLLHEKGAPCIFEKDVRAVTGLRSRVVYPVLMDLDRGGLIQTSSTGGGLVYQPVKREGG